MRAFGLLVVSALALVGGASPVGADGGPVGADLHVAQTLGERELTVVVRRVDVPPAPLRVDLVSHAGDPPGRLWLRVLPPGGSRALSEAEVELGAVPGARGAELRVERAGAWELEVDDGVRRARIPFTVPERVTPAWERVAYGGFVVAGVLVLVALGCAVRWGNAVALVPACGVVVALVVAVTAALLSPTIPAGAAAGLSRPAVNMTASMAAPAAVGRAEDLVLRFSDGATGRAVDDLLVHHDALVHLVVVDPAGELSHVHPVRVGPGEYRVRFAPARGGRHALAAEVARLGGGTQQVRAVFDVAGGGVPAPPPPPGPGPRVVGGAKVTLTAGRAVAGRPTSIDVDFGGASDLQPWLGMHGHMIVVGPLAGGDASAAPVWAHVHAMAPGAYGGAPDETVAAYPPRVGFTFTFPEPGRYRLWVQAERGYRVLTVPAVLDVAAEAGRP